MVGNIKSTKSVFIVDLTTTKEIYLQTLPLPVILYFDGDEDEYRIGCSVMSNKNGVRELFTVSKPYYRDETYFFVLNLETLTWRQYKSNLKFYGNF